MSETLDALHRHLSNRLGKSAKLAVWAHNSHLGDARATSMGERGELNVGQLTRERYGDDCVLVGFTTYTGTVTAASNWDGPAERKQIRPGLADSYESQMHDVGMERFFLPLRNAVAQALRRGRLERAIGVLYLPETERASHYFRARLPEQFDALFHFDTTTALQPLDDVSEWQQSEKETFPFGV
jgi:erythromycin esterase-like protein